MVFYFTNPVLLLLLLGLLPMVVITGRRLIGISTFRKVLIMVTRCLLFLVLVSALAGLKIAHKTDELAVMYLLDISRSIPREKLKGALEWLNESTKEMKQHDSAGVIVFGGKASIEKNLTPQLELSEIKSHIEDNRTDIASALRLSLAAFPEYTQKKIVLLSDGNENVGEAIDSAYMAHSNQVPIYVQPITITEKQDVRIEKMVAPHGTVKDAPFDLKVFLTSKQDTQVKLRLYKDDDLLLDEMVPVAVDKKNLYSVRMSLPDAGFHSFKALIEAPEDEVPENNLAYSFTHVKDVPRVLFVEGNPLSQSLLPALLSREKLELDVIEPGELPDTLKALLAYDCMVLSNVAVDRITFRQMEIIEKATHDFGIGLVVIGGDQAFGPGGYQDTPVEAALPVSMEIKHKRVLPNGAMVVILHTCEIPMGNTWAREITLAALRVLSRRDYFGVLYYDSMEQEKWLFEPQQIGNKSAMAKMIRQVVPQDMPSFDLTLDMAYEELSKLNTFVKHIVIISDGDPAGPNPQLAEEIAQSKITISTVVINPHSPRDADVMAALAKLGKGNFYEPQSGDELPQIFTKEAMTIRKSAIYEEPFSPRYVQYSDILTGFGQQDFPQLLGYVGTSAKETATVPLVTTNDDPLLAMWRFGLGKAIAFTSDATSRWAQQWTQWEKFDKFWVQVIRWATRETAGGNYLVSTTVEGDRTRLVLDALDDAGYFINYLEPRAHIVDPDLETQSLELIQISPGKYAADFQTGKPGNYLMSINVGKEDAPQIVVGGVSHSYSPEFNDSKTNEVLLSNLAQTSGGAFVTPEGNLFVHDLATVRQPREVWQYLAAAVIILLLFDIFERRVIFGMAELKDAYAKMASELSKLPLLLQKLKKAPVTVESTEALLRKRQEIWEGRKLQEQVKSEVLEKLKSSEPYREETEIEQQVPVDKKKEEKTEVTEEPAATEVKEETYLQKLLEKKRRKTKRPKE